MSPLDLIHQLLHLLLSIRTPLYLLVKDVVIVAIMIVIEERLWSWWSRLWWYQEFHQRDHYGPQNHISDRCWEKYGKLEWTQTMTSNSTISPTVSTSSTSSTTSVIPHANLDISAFTVRFDWYSCCYSCILIWISTLRWGLVRVVNNERDTIWRMRIHL